MGAPHSPRYLALDRHTAMAEESHLERTEPASPRRLEQAREEGQVVRSTELNTLVMLLAGAGGLWLTGGQLYAQLRVQMAAGEPQAPRAREEHDEGVELSGSRNLAFLARLIEAPW